MGERMVTLAVSCRYIVLARDTFEDLGRPWYVEVGISEGQYG